MPSVQESIAHAVRATTDAEARRNELRVAMVRVTSYPAVLVMDLVLAALELRPLGNALQSLVCVVIAAVLFALLYFGRFLHAYRFVMPAVDAVLIHQIVVLRGAAGPVMPEGLPTTIAVTCGLLAATGGMRFDRKAALWTTALAAGLFAKLVGTTAARTPSWAYGLLAIAAIGLLNMWLADLVRRSMEAARGREFLGRFLPPALLESAFKDPLSVLKEPRTLEATVLFTDLRGFTSLSETLPPATVMEILNRVQGAFADEVRAAGGVVDKFLGDGMLAVFGAPEPMADHAARAITAARGIRAALARLNASMPETPLRVGIGLHSGSVVAGCIGSGDRLEFTVIGDTVNTASRLEAMTKEHGVDALLSGETAQRAPGASLVELGEAPVRGRKQPLRIFRLEP